MISNIKMVIVIRKDLNMRRGKSEAMSAHAAMKVFFDRAIKEGIGEVTHMIIPLTSEMDLWSSGIFTKISLSCESEEELVELHNRAKVVGLPCSMIVDNGATEFHGIPTRTCIAIGPAKAEDIDKITGYLTLR